MPTAPTCQSWGAGLPLTIAVPAAFKAGEPSSLEFRKGLRDAIESSKNILGAHGIFQPTLTGHVVLMNILVPWCGLQMEVETGERFIEVKR
jgi:hypothetical protein